MGCSCSVGAPSWTGNAQLTRRSVLYICGFSARNWAFGEASSRMRQITSFRSPEKPAPGSECPALAFILPNAIGATWCFRTTAANELTSIGSPSDVPVPCASSTTDDPAAAPARAFASSRSACCARPFGAVMLADRPSWRTALPHRALVTAGVSSTKRRSTKAAHASDRQ